MRVFSIIATIAACAVATAAPLAQPDPPRLDPAEALKQLVKRVEPEIPESALSARVFGTVTAEIIVGTNGRVESVRIIKPVAMLSGPAADAIREWQFKPFLIAGKPARILTEVSIDFPKPGAAPARNLEKEYYDAAVKCRALIEAKSAQAVAACQDTVSRADALAPEHWNRRSESRFLAAQSAMGAAQYPLAAALFDESLALWLKNKPADVRVAEHHLLIGVVHRANQDWPKADAAFARAVAAYDERIAAGLAVDGTVRQELETLFRFYASVRRALKDEAGAKALEARAAKISGPTQPAPLVRRTIANTSCMGDGCERLNEAEVADLLKRIPQGARVWFIDAGSDPASANVTVYLEPDRDRADLRRGRTVFLSRKAQNPWERQTGTDPEWAQAIPPGRPPGSIKSPDDLPWPFLIRSTGRSGGISDDDVVAVAMAVHAAGDATRAKNLPERRLHQDVQPWPIGSMEVSSNANQVTVYLRSPERGELPQVVTLMREGKVWRVSGIKSGT